MFRISDTDIAAHLASLGQRLAGGKLRLYTAPPPARGAALTTQTLVSVHDLAGAGSPASAGTVAGNMLTLAPIAPGLVLGTDGVPVAPAWGRAETSGGEFVADFTVGSPTQQAAGTVDLGVSPVDGADVPMLLPGGYLTLEEGFSITYPVG